ncbi:hypothetical protein NHX12_021198 [Muraenolepis orangiensis]|uniref:Uncharacterized protein n=1 Tax=Muraenolepis orangiensis TaxID=630683 RepID=A0A9Q0EPL3_9TELE|nr:hypothetical protein NHX12_021198 [Muraenolepis orangiensis]
MAELDLSLSDALSDIVAQPGQEARVERDFMAQLESEAFDDQIGETVGKTDYIPLLDGDDTATGSKGTAGHPEQRGEVRHKVDQEHLTADFLSASMASTPRPLCPQTGPVQGVDPSPMGTFSAEPQSPYGPLDLATGASQGDCWPAACLPSTPSVSTVISRHAGQLESSPDQLSPDCQPHRESLTYGGAQEESPTSGDALYQRVGPRRDKAAGDAGEGGWEEQIGKGGGRGKRGKSRKKLPEEWALPEPFVPSVGPHVQAEMLVELGAAVPSLPLPEGPYLGMDHGEHVFSPSVTQLAQSSGLKATAAPFTMPAASVPLGSFPMSPGPAHPHHEQNDLSDVVDNRLFDQSSVLMESYTSGDHLTDTSPFSSQLLSDSASFDLDDLPATLGCPLPVGLVLDATHPVPLRSPRTTAQDCRAQPKECQDAVPSRKHRSSSSSSSSSLKSPTFNAPPEDSPGLTSSSVVATSPGSPGSYLNPAAKPFYPGFNEPTESPTVAPSLPPVFEVNAMSTLELMDVVTQDLELEL